MHEDRSVSWDQLQQSILSKLYYLMLNGSQAQVTPPRPPGASHVTFNIQCTTCNLSLGGAVSVLVSSQLLNGFCWMMCTAVGYCSALVDRLLLSWKLLKEVFGDNADFSVFLVKKKLLELFLVIKRHVINPARGKFAADSGLMSDHGVSRSLSVVLNADQVCFNRLFCGLSALHVEIHSCPQYGLQALTRICDHRIATLDTICCSAETHTHTRQSVSSKQWNVCMP